MNIQEKEFKNINEQFPIKSKLYVSKNNVVIEVSTNQKLFKINKKHVRHNYLKRLNSGSGFCGFTPKFFIYPFIEK